MREADLVHIDDRTLQADLFAALAANGLNSSGPASSEAVVRWVHADGRELFVRVCAHAVTEGYVPPTFAVYQVADVTVQRRAEAALRGREEGFRVAFDHARAGMMFLDLDGRIRKANAALAALLGRRQEHFVGDDVAALAAVDDRGVIRTAVKELVAGHEVSYEAEHPLSRSDGSHVWALLSGSLVQDQDGRPSYLVFQVTDVTARKEAEFRLAHHAVHDDLTGLPNRVLLHDHLKQACARAERVGTHVAVLFVDLDDFKDINDTFGHLVGDQVLTEVAGRLSGCLRGTDTAARIGGDEFVLVCGDLDDPGEATAVAVRVEAAFSVPVALGSGRRIEVNASIGITTASGTTAPEELLGSADTAMYRAKINGKSRHEVYEPWMRVSARRETTLVHELEAALSNDEFRLHYQPMYDTQTGAIVAVEALLRWQHPTRGLLTPGHFLDVAEGRRLMTPIGDWVLATAAAQAARWQHEAAQAPDMWVNISSDQLGTRTSPASSSACSPTRA